MGMQMTSALAQRSGRDLSMGTAHCLHMLPVLYTVEK